MSSNRPPKNHPHIPPKKSMSVPKHVFLSDPGQLIALKTGGVKLKTMEKTFTFTFVGVTKGSYPYPRNSRVGLLRHHRLCEELSPHGPWVTTIIQYHWHLPKSACFLNPEINVPEKHGGFFLGTCFFWHTFGAKYFGSSRPSTCFRIVLP